MSVAELAYEVEIDATVSVGLQEGAVQTFTYSSEDYSWIKAKTLSVVDAHRLGWSVRGRLLRLWDRALRHRPLTATVP
jgi:hypothetical protein